jgi:hypothetical protein
MEIVRYSVGDFLVWKNKVEIDEKTKKYVENILSPDYCQAYQENIKEYFKNTAVKKEVKNKVKTYQNKDKRKVYFSFMNKMSPENYSKVILQLKEYVSQKSVFATEDLLLRIFLDVWCFCYRQPCYSHLYIKCFYIDLKEFTQTPLIKDNTQSIIIEFLDTSWSFIHTNNEDYDTLCQVNKEKKHFFGKIKALCDMYKLQVITEDLFNTLYDIKVDEFTRLEVYQIIHEFFGLKEEVLAIIDTKYKTETNLKTKFQLLNILEKRPFKF